MLKKLKSIERAEFFRIISWILAIHSIIFETIFASDFVVFIYQLPLILFLIYIFIYKGKSKNSLLGISLLLHAALILFDRLWAVMFIGLDGLLRLNTIIGMLYVLIAISVFKIKIDFFAKISIVIAYLLIIYIAYLDYSYNINYISWGLRIFILGLLRPLPLFLFIFFCPLYKKGINKYNLNSQIQEQELIMNDINSQLQDLKSEFDNGMLTQQEYENRRKSLIDKL